MNKLTKTSSLTLASFLIVITIIGVNTDSTYAESTSANAAVTVANTISLTLTGGDLVIDNLTPGNAADSNSITATVTSNSPFGFHLAATTGTSTGTDSLVNTADSNFTFANLSTNKASLSNFSDNTWGYSYSTDGTNWISGDYGSAITGYNGLPLDNNDSGATSTTLFNSDSYLGSKAVQFKIGAKSATTQAAGTYVGTINFYAVTNPAPPNYMQDMTTAKLNQLMPNTHDTTTLYDKRDEQAYTVAKLADGKYWMTENLNLAGGTALSANDTNVTSSYIESFSTSNNLTKESDTIVLPASSKSGFSLNNYSYVFNSGNKTSNCANPGCYSYYSWDAAVLGSGRNITYNNYDVTQSICPKSWRLPKSRTTGAPNWQTASDFYTLIYEYGFNSTTSTSGEDSDFYENAGPGTIPNFLVAGLYQYYNGAGEFALGGTSGFYWSSTSSGDGSAHSLYFLSSSSYTSSTNSYRRETGLSVRCLFSGQ